MLGSSAIRLWCGAAMLATFAYDVSHAHNETCSLARTSCTGDSSFQSKEYFPGIPHIRYEGPESKNAMAFKWYNASEEVAGKPMSEWLRFSVAFWHTMRGDGSDQFGLPTKVRPWETAENGDKKQGNRNSNTTASGCLFRAGEQARGRVLVFP